MKITRPLVDAQLERLNRTLDLPLTPYTMVNGQCQHNPGNIHLDNAYGGYSVQRICEGGGAGPLTRHGYFSLKDISAELTAYQRAVDDIRLGYLKVTIIPIQL